VFILENTPPPPHSSADVIWGKKYEKERKEENMKEKGEKTKDKGEI
jgi:hypothetical protein